MICINSNAGERELTINTEACILLVAIVVIKELNET